MSNVIELSRVRRGHPAGGQFVGRRRPEGPRLFAIQPISEFESKRLARGLDAARNLMGVRLAPANISAITNVVHEPSAANWEVAHGAIIHEDGTTLWQAACTHAGYEVRHRPADQVWTVVPTRQQLLLALTQGAERGSTAAR